MKLLVVLVGLCLYEVYCQGDDEPTQPKNELDQNYVHKKRHEIQVLIKANDLLRRETTKLKIECDEVYKTQWDIFNELATKVKTEQSKVVAMKRNLTVLYKRDEKLKTAIAEVQNYNRIFILKRKILDEDVKLLEHRRDEYQSCTELAQEIKFEPVTIGTIGTRSLRRNEMSPENVEHISGFIHERKVTWLRIQKELEMFRNYELKKYQRYFVGFCRRRLENIQNLIRYLKLYPASDSLKEDDIPYHRLLQLVDEKEAELNNEVHNLRIAYREINELQTKYDRMINVARCFKKLSQWHLGDYIDSIYGVTPIHSKETDVTETLGNEEERELNGSDNVPKPGEANSPASASPEEPELFEFFKNLVQQHIQKYKESE